MSTQIYSTMTTERRSFRWSFWIVGLALVAGLILSFLSWLEICVEHCSANQDYRLFGLPFAIAGILFFTGLMIFHALSRKYEFLSYLVSWGVAAAFGSELMFIAIQKYQIGHWCPVCLSIATAVGIAGLALVTKYSKEVYTSIQHKNRGEIMQHIKRGLFSFTFLILGFLMAFTGVHKVDAAELALKEMKERLAFGQKNSPVEVYFVTDWFCPSCKKIESQIETLFPKIQSHVTFYFVDYPIHKKSVNFTPYNLSFLINNKAQYFEARQILTALADTTETPTDKEVASQARKYGIPFRDLTFLDIKTGIEYFDTIVEKYNLNSTPTIIITNTHDHRTNKFEGTDEISEEKVLKAIETLSKPV